MPILQTMTVAFLLAGSQITIVQNIVPRELLERPDIQCSAPRTPCDDQCRLAYPYAATVVAESDYEILESGIIAKVRIKGFLKGRFSPKIIDLIFSKSCGWGGDAFKKGDELKVFMNIRQSYAIAGNWYVLPSQR